MELPDLDFKSWMSRKTDVRVFSRQANYGNWFSDSITQGKLSTLASRIERARTSDERSAALLESHAAMVLYSTLIYYVYPNTPSMKREIDSSPELRDNFSRLKGWFDSNGGPRIAEDFYKDLVSGLGEVKTGS